MYLLKEGHSMPQSQVLVPLRFLDGERHQAVATGNNAAWKCRCGYAMPLVGRSGRIEKIEESMTIECPSCHRRFCVMPEGKDRGRVLEVKEIV